ncbi:MAG: PDZ domain-containing protein [Planctomycetota bacterium]|jgi:hypothetical protein
MWRWLLSLALCALPAVAQEDPAALMPADAMVYLELDAAAVEKGLPELGLVKLLTDPRLRPFFQPTFDRLGLDQEQPVASLLEMLPVKQFLAGKAAVGVAGMTFRLKPKEGKETVIHLSRDKPLDARAAHVVAGLALREEWDDDFEPDEVSFSSDTLVFLEPGPALKALVLNFLANPPIPINRSKVNIGEREVERLVAPMLGPTVEVFAYLGEKRWLIATSRKLMADALAGGPRSSLANSPSHRSIRTRMTGGQGVLFGYADLQPLMKILSKLIPPIIVESSEITGLSSLRGLGFGISITEGGLRESVGVILDGDPKGAWKLLDAFPGGLHALEWAPPGAMAAVGMKFDAQLLVQRWREVAAEVVPGNEGLLEHALDGVFRRDLGWDFKQDVLPALGDEIGVFVFPPAMGGMIPDVVIGVDFSNEEVFRKMLERIKTLAAATGQVRFQPVQVTETIEGFQVFAPLPMQLTFAVAKGHLFGASNPQLLQKVLTEWGAEGAPSLLKDGPVFAQTLRGLNGGSNGNLVALGYLNLRKSLPMAYTMLPMMMGGAQLPKEWVDVTKVPDLQRMASHVSGAAVGLRRDGDGITLDAFSPAGLLIPATAYTIYEERERQKRWARAVVAEAPAQPRPAGKAWLGINMMSSDGTGVTVLGFSEGSVAKAGGMKVNDKITAINDVAVKSIEDLRREIAKYAVGTEVKVWVTRGMFTIKLGRMPGR